MACNADDHAALPDWRIEHRRDSVRAKVVLGELGRSFIGVTVVGCERAVLLQRAKVRRIIARQELEAAEMRGRWSKEKIPTDDLGSFVVEHPDRRSFDVDRPCSDLGDHVKRNGEVFGLVPKTRELEQCLLVLLEQGEALRVGPAWRRIIGHRSAASRDSGQVKQLGRFYLTRRQLPLNSAIV
ncbi:MAG: hypothetical protein IPF82_08995 [Blastocatellia bacterium]|nr:hypothetical protein [Blastocatellia bacterium]